MIKNIACLLLCAVGVTVVVFSGFMMFQPVDWVTRGALLVLGCFGVALAAFAVAVMRGARPKDIMQDLFTSLLGL